MKVVLIVRATLHTVKGGDTYQVIRTAEALGKKGIIADIKLTTDDIEYQDYDLLHFFNIIRPSDILYHIRKSHKPFVVSPLLVDYFEFEKYHRKGISGTIFRYLGRDAIEYMKTLARWLLGRDVLRTKSYLWKGHRRSIMEILKKASMVLPNSAMEYENLVALYRKAPPYTIVPNGVDNEVFHFPTNQQKDPLLVLCVGRIEGIKNQLTLIRALNNSKYRLIIIGAAAPAHRRYYEECRKVAA